MEKQQQQQQRRQREPSSPMWQVFGESLWWRHFCDNAPKRFYASVVPRTVRAVEGGGGGAAAAAPAPSAANVEATTAATGKAAPIGTAGDEAREAAVAAVLVGDCHLPSPQHWTLDHLFPKNIPSWPVQHQQQEREKGKQAEKLETQREKLDASTCKETESAESTPRCRGVAVLDLDGTIITTKSGKRFPVDSDDWRLLHTPQTQEKLKELVDAGYHLVVLSNQLGVEKGHTPLQTLTRKCESLQHLLGLPMTICLAVADDLLRKPRPAAAVFIFDWLLPYLHQCCCCTSPIVAPLSCSCHSSPTCCSTTRQHHKGQLQRHITQAMQLPLPLAAGALPVAFFVGDAAGRRGTGTEAATSTSRRHSAAGRCRSRAGEEKFQQQGRTAAAAKDHGDADVKFALNTGLPFFTPEQFFLGISGEVPPLLLAYSRLQVDAGQSGTDAPQEATNTPVTEHELTSPEEVLDGSLKIASVVSGCYSTERLKLVTGSFSATGDAKFSSQQKLAFLAEGKVFVRNGHASATHTAAVSPSQSLNKAGLQATFDPRLLLRIMCDKDQLAVRKRLLMEKLRGAEKVPFFEKLDEDGRQLGNVPGVAISPKRKHPRMFSATDRQEIETPSSNDSSTIDPERSLRAGAAEQFSASANHGADNSLEKTELLHTLVPADEQEMVLLVGAPGSGKSTLAYTFFEDYVSVCQDELRVQQKCTRACEASLRAGKSVIVDIQNIRRQTRSMYIALAKHLGIKKVRCVLLLWPKDFCKHTILYRSLVAQYRAYRSQLQLKSRRAHSSDEVTDTQTAGGKPRGTLLKKKSETGESSITTKAVDIRFRLERVPGLVVDKFYKHLEQPSTEEGLTDIVVLKDLDEFFVPAHFASLEEQQLFFSYL